jgi:hypothetical protein
MNHFDQASRYAAKLDAIAFLRWLLDDLAGRYRFFRWLDARRLPFPGDPEGFCDTVAELDDSREPSPPWAVPIEFQTEPDSAMFGRFLMYLGQLWLERRPDKERDSRYQVAGIVVNLTGHGHSSRDMTLGDTGLRTHLAILDCDLADKKAHLVLEGIAAGAIGRVVLPWIPLMRGGDESAIIERWKELALQEPDERRRAEYAGLALVFAEAADRRTVWKEALKEWNVKVSQQVLEWQAEARAQGAADKQAESILRLLNLRFPGGVPADLAEGVRAVRDLGKLDRWFDAAATVPSVEEFRRVLGNGGM